jgi:hypothetical protein
VTALLRAGLSGEPDEFVNELDAARLPVRTLSPSAISTLLSCPEQFRAKYVLNVPDPAGPWGVSGTAFHVVTDEAVRLARQGETITAERAEEVFNEEWPKVLEKEGPGVRWGRESPASMRKAALDKAIVYARAIEKGRVVVAPDTRTEEWVEGYLPGVPLRIVGRLDRVSRTTGIVDTKTGKRGTSKPNPSWLIQGLVYIALTGLDVEWHVISTTQAGPKLWLPDEYPALRLQAWPSRVEAGEGYVRAAYHSLVDYMRRYGPEERWPGVGVVSDSCFFCPIKTRCIWNPAL